ncbi:Tripeptidyl-peptidase [Fasciola hepatica]|uniref:Tripeptidyl-peptidase n=1 Tax=Fasciola hepatica TaxID=6192 RepID=A0A4E0R531_FASHE|nr:Tripeptidyl-peptidase [Fasciola hepatica]
MKHVIILDVLGLLTKQVLFLTPNSSSFFSVVFSPISINMDMTSVSELLPKKHINADAFAESNPTADGSTTVIAIWDTGVDPTAGGLQVTPDGKPKIIDFIDASGCGDVKMRTKFRLSGSERTVKSLTGRQIMIPTHWKPKNGEIRMGVKLASELFPRALLQRLRNENKDDVWSPCVKRLASHIAGDFSNAEEQLTESYESRWRTLSLDTHPGPVNQENQHTVSSETRSTQNLTVKDDTEGLDCDQLKSAARLLEDALVTFDRHYVAPEMVYDCFVFHDGAQWLACVDTSPYNPGKTLADMPLLADYSVGHQCACFGDDTQLFFTVKILNEGKLLQIVTNDSEHGTHVAAMAAAFFPSTQSDQLSTGSVESTLLKRNGVAPGAQIVSIKISDSRLGSMETGVSLLRAIRWTVKLKCDVVNYSFGEHCVWPNVGRLSKHLNELVNTYGIVMVASGGNNGPGLGTVGSPGSSVDALIGVAPLVFPDMMRVLYSQPYLSPCDVLTYGDSMDRGLTVDTESSGPSNNCPRPFGRAAPTAYTWGSRGPALDGSLGLCVAAPGAANTSVASWKLRPSALLNGSSMSAPLVTGCVALLLSGLRHRWSRSGNSVDPTAYRIPPTLVRLAIMNTACPVPHLSSLDQGHGVIQVDKAFNYLLKAIDRGYGSGSPSAADRYTSQHSTNCVDPNPQCVDCGGMTQFPNCVEKAPHSDCEQEKNHVLPAIFPSSGLFGWRVRCTVTGPGCVYRDQGIWIRRGWFPRSSIGAVHAIRHRLPVLRYTVHISIDFDKSVPLETRRRLELHLISAVYMNHSADPIPMPSDKPTWLQIAQLISVTSLGRDVSLVIDPNQFVHSTVGSTNGTEHGRHSPAELVSGIPVAPCHRVERKGMNHDWHSNSASSFCWPSSLSTSQHMTPVMSTEPQITMLGFFDSHQPHLGPLARIPITIHNPISLSALSSIGNPKITFCDTFDSLHKVRRWFVEVPTGSTAGVIRLARLDENDAACEFKVTVCMPQPRSGLTTGQQETTWPLVCLSRCGRNCIVPGRARSANRRSADDFDGAVQLAFPIPWEADYLELTIAQHWGLEQPATVIGDLYFRGLQPSVPQLSMNSSDHYIRMVLRSNFSTEEILPSISLTHWVLPLRPKESKISYLGHGEEEVLVNQTGCYALRLIYQFTCPFKSSVSQFELPWLQELLYDSDYLVQLYHLYDWRGRFIGAGDYDLKSAKKPKFTFNLERGDYKVVVQICHEQGASLGSSHSKLGDSERDGVRPVEQSNRSTLSPSSVSTAVGSTGSDQQGPLERIRHHPALIRFRLPSPGIANQSSVQPSGHPVTFEFSAFAFSLGLNGTKPCSALDPIPYERCMNGTNNELGYSMDTNPLQENRRGELNRRCLCLPTNLAAKESTSLFIGLTDERTRSLLHWYYVQLSFPTNICVCMQYAEISVREKCEEAEVHFQSRTRGLQSCRPGTRNIFGIPTVLFRSHKKPIRLGNLRSPAYRICHEQGASLGSSHSKLGDSERDGVRPVEQSNRSTLSPSSVSTAVGSTGSDQQGPLERIRHHPALIRFRLPSPGIANQSSVQPSGHPVTFEFSAFAFSLGLNGTKPCSALDPIPYERCMNGTNNELGYSMDTNPLQENRRGELNRRCLCLPTNLAAKESTSLFIGLTDERYPSYAVRGSYFAGSISFYNSDVLQGVVNYPFRLVIDSDLMGSDNLSQSRKDEPESSGSCLCVDSMGISVEDFSWLRPLSDCICLIRSHGLSFEVDQSDLLAQSKLLDFGSSVRDTDPENIGKEGVSRAKHLHLDEFSNETTLLCDASELGMQPVEELTRADSPGNERNEMGSNGKVNALSVEITNDCSTKKEVPLDQDSSIDHLSKEPTPEVISTNTTEQRPRSAPSPTVSEVGLDKCRNSLKINNGGPPTPAAEIPLSRRLAHIHERLTRIDAPCSTTCATWSDMVQLQSRRRQVWSLAERIIFGHSLDDSFAQQPGAVENNGTDQLPRSRDDQNPSSNDNFFHHLLTVRVVSAPRSSTHQSDQLTTGMRTTEEVSPADCTVRNSHMSRSDPELNREPSEVISHHLTASMSTTKQSSAECIQLPSESVGVKKKSSKKDGPVHNYLELKLRLVDILARFGRLLCERVLLTRFSCCQYNSVPAKNVTGSHDLSRDPIRSGWTLTEWLLRNLDSQAIAPSSIYKSSTPEKDRFFDDRITRTYLPQIHARLIQLTTTTAVSSSSVGDRVEIGAHALPAWMLASGVRELCASVDMEQSGIGNPSMQIGGGSWNHGSVGGRLVLFFLLYHIVQERYAQALRLLSRITYQIEEPPTGAFRGLIPCGSTPSLGPLRSVHSTPINSLLTAKHSHHWLIWILDRIGWKEVATYMEQRAPIIFPENDYSLMADFH